MADGSSRAIAIRSEPPAEDFAQRPGSKCPRCEDMELVECDLCDEGREGCLRCEGTGLIVCPACDESAAAPVAAALAASPPLASLEHVGSRRADAACRVSHRKRCATKEQSSIADPGPQPEGGGAAGCALRLKWARLRLQMSLEALAQLAGYSVSAVHSYENGRPASGPPLRAIEDLAQALRVRRSWLAFGLGAVELAPRLRRAPGEEQEETHFMEAMR